MRVENISRHGEGTDVDFLQRYLFERVTTRRNQSRSFLFNENHMNNAVAASHMNVKGQLTLSSVQLVADAATTRASPKNHVVVNFFEIVMPCLLRE